MTEFPIKVETVDCNLTFGVADSRYEPITVGIRTLFRFLQNHTAIQQHYFHCTLFFAYFPNRYICPFGTLTC